MRYKESGTRVPNENENPSKMTLDRDVTIHHHRYKLTISNKAQILILAVSKEYAVSA
jgi:hypothetical protein